MLHQLRIGGGVIQPFDPVASVWKWIDLHRWQEWRAIG